MDSKKQKEEIPSDHLICASVFVVNNTLYIKVKQKGLITNMSKILNLLNFLNEHT